MRLRNIAFALVALSVAAGCSDGGTAPPPVSNFGALISFAFTGYPADTIRVITSNQAVIFAAQQRIAKGSGPQLIIGKIVRGAGVDARYPFHFLDDGLQLTDTAIELCDGAPMHTASEVDAFFLGSTGNSQAQSATWCPWASYPVKVDILFMD